ncbi:HAMP domain-containing histidine kinase [Desulfosporosinus fructosivorans]|uniref:histidine kinase n=1 Tax=Desulfosporosinus fructosivorans TaxID=2018669 RepID=A0A4Z0QVU8_9FIRM|nr:HAMP domain-containing sensor histidine kinase [Desulfosporosinus fructosivorans]TGE34961.1 HAMP domain-containing histidine kinase [Desulfosporosinus fructosivorans]
MRRKKEDKRIDTSFISFKDFAGILLVLIIFIVGGLLIYLATVKEDFWTTYSIFGYLILMALILTVITGIMRHYSFSRPMRRLSEAARKIAEGDFSVRVAPLRKDGKKDYIEVMFNDFNKMAEELASIETLKSDYIANVSHEIKTPLSVIQSYAMALQHETLSPEERREYAKTVVTAAQKLSALVTNILKLNKLENQAIMPGSAPYDLSEQLRCCALAFEDLWESKGITFTADLDETIVSYDESMLELVWNNLLSNAIKFTNPGGSIALTLKIENGLAVVSVKDSGCGMDEAVRKHVFDKFYQGDTSHSQEGNGLGLALVKKVIEIIGGGITVDSKIGYGTTFTVCLKIA